MAKHVVNGVTEAELQEKEAEYYENSDLYHRYNLEFEEAYCCRQIPNQPEDYDGPTRYCSKPAAKRYEDAPKPRYVACRAHGKDCGGRDTFADRLPDETYGDPPLKISHGMYAEDENLMEDLSENEQELVERTLQWAEAYGWPPEEEDPARYNILERLALNFVRENRALGRILEEGEVETDDVLTSDGEIVEMEQSHKLAEPIRMLQKEIQDLMDDLGITPKAAARMDKQESEATAAEQIGEIAADALNAETEYDPSEFEDE